jgi:hypothetical protein
MLADELEVKAIYPSARVIFHQNYQQFKVYYLRGDCSVALSSFKESQGEAWEEAARLLRGRIDTLRQLGACESFQESKEVG